MHKKLRKEKNCLNCGNTVNQKFCSNCGQENLELHDSSIHLILHYLQDLVHYDGKFWHTLRTLFLRPGQVAKEYIEGKRVRNLDPVRFYVFASTLFFIVFFITGEHKAGTKNIAENYNSRLYNLAKEKEFFKGQSQQVYADSLYNAIKQQKAFAKSSKDDAKIELENELINNGIKVNIDTTIKKNPDENSTVSSNSDWIEKTLLLKKKKMDEEYQGDERRMITAFIDELKHKLPQVFFVSLPFFAFFLWLLHRRKTKKPYSENFIFSVYHYAYVFVISLIAILLALFFKWILPKNVASTMNAYMQTVVFIYLFIYLAISMKRFFTQSFGRALFKEIAALLLSSIIMVFLIGLVSAFLLLLF